MSHDLMDSREALAAEVPSQSSQDIDGGVQITLNESTSIDETDVQSVKNVDARDEPKQQKKKQRCRFFATRRGCRAGDSCPFLHDQAKTEAQIPDSSVMDDENTQKHPTPPEPLPGTAREQQPQTVPNQQRDPRAFQLNQITRRFQARQELSENGLILLKFSMPPSDPDFPFDIDALECTLKIPPSFPKVQRPALRVTNKEMERGYQINVEKGFDAIWSQAANPTLLNAMKVLDKRLEVLLTAQKAEIVKLVANAGLANPAPPYNTEITTGDPGERMTASSSKIAQEPPKPARPIISAERRAKATAKRETEVQILEHRLGRNPQFSKAADGTLFTVQIDPRKRTELPPSLQSVKAVQLLVPPEYDIEPCTIELLGVDGEEARNVSTSFLKRVQENPDGTLLAHINYLAQNMHTMAATASNAAKHNTKSVEPSKPRESGTIEATSAIKDNGDQTAKDTDREHVKIIQRPPEWDTNPELDGDEESTDGYDSEYDTSEEEEAEENAEQGTSQAPSAPREKGILISFPGLELHSIELLELVLVNLTVKCERCKDAMDVSRVKPQSEENPTPNSTDAEVHSTSCKKCANPFSIGYRKDIMHLHSIRAGYLDLEGCTIVDLLPSTFLPTCSDCSTPASANGGIVSVRGESSLAICRSCHLKMNFRIPEVKFLNIGPSSLHNLPLRPTRKPKKESLGIVAGTPLPNRGRCTHYSKSFRWFRFSCCNAVYACDKCHDRATDHPNEFANRMICGWCSREQHYRPEDCIHCRKNVTGRTGSGFWEGGKGTRERARMSRKDPRKYKRRGGGAIAARNK